MSGAPIIIGRNQLPKPPIKAGITTKKHHNQAVGRDDCIPQMAVGSTGGIGQKLYAWLLQFHAHNNAEGTADDRGDDAEDQVERADIFVVGGEEPTDKETGGMATMVVVTTVAVLVVVCVGICHFRLSLQRNRRSHYCADASLVG